MSNFGIPNFVVKGLSNLFRLEIVKQNSILERLIDQEGKHPLDLVDELTVEIDLSDVEGKEPMAEIVHAIASFLKALIRYPGQVQTIVETLIEDLESQNLKREFLEERIAILIDSTRGTSLTLKAYDLAYNRSRVLTETRIISDIRPIFTDDEDCKIQGSLIVHNLKLLFQEDGETKEHYFAIDGADLKNLHQQIERAQKKEAVLEDQLNNEGIKRIKVR